MNRAPGESRTEYLRRTDRRVLRILTVFLVIGLFLVVVVYLSTFDIDVMFNNALSIVSVILIVIGIMTWVSRGELGIVHTSKIFLCSTLAAIVFGATVAVFLFLDDQSIWMGIGPGLSYEFRPQGDILMTLATFGVVAFGAWGTLLGFVSIGFGVVWITAVITRNVLPWILQNVKGFSGDGSDPVPVKITVWLVCAPEVLDMNRLQLDQPVERSRFPVSKFFLAVGWEIFIGTILAVYVSLNPIVLENLSLGEAVSLLSSLSLIIPLVVIPWFAFTAINARVTGVKKDFLFFKGIRSRILQTFVALGTIALFLRLALREYELGTLFSSFMYFYLTLTFLAILFTFIYFNFFEFDLGQTVKSRYERLEGGHIE